MIAIAATFLTSLLPYVSHAGLQPEETQNNKKPALLRSVPGEIIVRFRGGALTGKTSDQLLVAESQRGPIAVTVERLHGPEIIEGLRIARVEPDDTARAIEALRARPDVIYAEPNFIRRKNAVPNDSMYGDLWGLKNVGQNGGTAGVDIKAEEAWNLTTGSPNVVVAVIDEGIDSGHPDLNPNIWLNPGEVAGNNVDDDGNGFVDDRNGFDFVNNDASVYDGPGLNPDDSPIDAHGTHVAGTIGAQGNNGAGVVGVNWDVSLMSLKTIGPNGATTSDLLEAYGYAKMMRDRWVNTSGAQGANIRVTNNSYGGDGYSQAEADAIAAMGASGILFVASAGNDGRDLNIVPSYPANYELQNVIAVASIDRTGTRSSFSNYGSRLVHIAAPGSGVLSTMPGNNYAFANGTSMAAPHVTGVAALVLSAHPEFSLNRLRAATLFGGTPTAPMATATLTGRLVSAFGSLQNANEVDTSAPAPFSDLEIGGQDGRTVVLQWTATGDDGSSGQASLLEVRFVDALTNAQFLLSIIKPPAAGTLQTLNVNVPYRHPNGAIRLTAIDNAGNSVDTSINVTVDAETIDPYSIVVVPAEALSVGGQALGFNFDDFVGGHGLPFSFPFYDKFYNQLFLSSNGAIYFANQPAHDASSAIHALNGRTMIAGLWDDIDLRKCFRADSDIYRVTPDNDRVIYRWQGVRFTSPNCPSSPVNTDYVNFEIELRRDGTIKTRYGQNTALRPVVGIGSGEPEGYLISTHTSEATPIDLSNAQSVQFSLRRPPPVADLSISSVVSPEVAQVGENISFDLKVTNHGPSRTSNIVVTDTLPGAASLVSCTVPQGACTAPSNGIIQIDLGVLESGASNTIKLVVQVTSALGGFMNNATVRGPHNDPETFNNSINSVCQIVAGNHNPQTGILGISASGNQSFAIRSDRYGLAWGHNLYGQLGDGSVSNKSLPVRINGISSLAAIDGGLFHTLGLRQDGSVWGWGNNDKGQLGDGTTLNHKLPTKIATLTDVTEVSAGGSHSMALKGDGTVWVWGDNSSGQLGDGSTSGSLTPKQVPGLTGVRNISAGVNHSLVVKTDGTVWAWGGNESGQLGDSTTTGRTSPVMVNLVDNITAVSAGEGYSFFGQNGLTNVTFSVALRSDGTVWTWGHNWRGQLGDGTVVNRSTPVQVAGLTGVSTIAAGGFHVLALKTNGTVWTWGGNFDGQLGDLTAIDRLSPVQVTWLTGIQAIAAGSEHSLALRQDGHVFGWGSYISGQLGFGGTVGHLVYPYEVSAQIPDPPPIGVVSTPTFSPNGGTFSAALNTTIRSATGDANINTYSTGGFHNFVRLSDGSFYGWGSNSHGQLGTDPGYPMPDPNKTVFKTVARVNGLDNVLSLALGQNHNVALKTDGTVWTSGGNSNNQLGYETNRTPRPSFGQVPGLSSVTKVAAGFDRSVALKADGTVWAWGFGPINTESPFEHFPTQVNGLSNIKDVATGAGSFAIGNDGTLWAWGNNYQGVLGDGTETQRPVPVQIAGINNAVAVAPGADHTVLLKSDGTVWGWGNNSSGQLGIGDDFTGKLSPVQVPGLSGVIAITAGAQFTMALKSDGTVWAWGSNHDSELGDGTNIQRRTPVKIASLSGIISIMSGYKHTVARAADGKLFTWGFNQHGQIGDGTTDNQNNPIEISQITGGVSIHYTTNGNDPTENDPSITSGTSLPISQSLVLKARAFKSGWTPSLVHTATFTISAQTVDTIQLTDATFSLFENDNKATVTISRSGTTAAAATVDYATTDTAGLTECNVVNGIASSRCDYATTIGTALFAPGEASKTIFIPIVNDGYAEGNETFSITLNNPVGATLGSFATANVTIQDNETSNSANPLDQVDFFIEQHYIDFLGRNPEPAGLEGWRNVLTHCGVTVSPPCDRIEVSAGFFRSPEFQARGYFIYRFYSSVGAIPLYEQFMPDFAKVSGFLSDAQLEANKAAFVNDFMNRAAFQNKYASTLSDPTAYVDALLQTVGLPSHPSRTTWINQLNANNTSQTRGEVLRALVEGQQVYDKYYNEAFVIMQYFGYLRRTADASYLDWINTMNQTNGDYRIMINGFMNSAEYRKRFGP